MIPLDLKDALRAVPPCVRRAALVLVLLATAMSPAAAQQFSWTDHEYVLSRTGERHLYELRSGEILDHTCDANGDCVTYSARIADLRPPVIYTTSLQMKCRDEDDYSCVRRTIDRSVTGILGEPDQTGGHISLYFPDEASAAAAFEDLRQLMTGEGRTRSSGITVWPERAGFVIHFMARNTTDAPLWVQVWVDNCRNVLFCGGSASAARVPPRSVAVIEGYPIRDQSAPYHFDYRWSADPSR